MPHLDKTDRKILAHLQSNGRLTSNELGELVALSPSQCARRRARLESEGYIRGYHADIDRKKLGYDLVVLIFITVSDHSREGVYEFVELVKQHAEILEAYELTGSMDYVIKAVSENLSSLSLFINEVLLPNKWVNHVNTAIVLDTFKFEPSLPVLQIASHLGASRKR